MTTQQISSFASTSTLYPRNEPEQWDPLPRTSKVEHAYHLGGQAIRKLFNIPADHAHRYEIAEMSLIAAYGLPGTLDIDMGATLRRLDQWAEGAAVHILKASHQYGRHRTNCYDSLARFRMTLMIQYLVRECGIRPNPEEWKVPILNAPPLTEPGDTFIHGPLGDRRCGMCGSLSTLLVAIGRKLGFPLKLVLTSDHAFCRWDSPTERFNIEMRVNGLNSHPDEYYTHWPFEWRAGLHEQQRAEPFLLRSMTPAQELAFCARFAATIWICPVDLKKPSPPCTLPTAFGLSNRTGCGSTT